MKETLEFRNNPLSANNLIDLKWKNFSSNTVSGDCITEWALARINNVLDLDEGSITISGYAKEELTVELCTISDYVPGEYYLTDCAGGAVTLRIKETLEGGRVELDGSRKTIIMSLNPGTTYIGTKIYPTLRPWYNRLSEAMISKDPLSLFTPYSHSNLKLSRMVRGVESETKDLTNYLSEIKSMLPSVSDRNFDMSMIRPGDWITGYKTGKKYYIADTRCLFGMNAICIMLSAKDSGSDTTFTTSTLKENIYGVASGIISWVKGKVDSMIDETYALDFDGSSDAGGLSLASFYNYYETSKGSSGQARLTKGDMISETDVFGTRIVGVKPKDRFMDGRQNQQLEIFKYFGLKYYNDIAFWMRTCSSKDCTFAHLNARESRVTATNGYQATGKLVTFAYIW